MIEWPYHPKGSFSLSTFADWQTSTEQDKKCKEWRKESAGKWDCTNDVNNCLTVWYAKVHPLKSLKNCQCSTRAVKSETYKVSLAWQYFLKSENSVFILISFIIILLSLLCNDVQWLHITSFLLSFSCFAFAISIRHLFCWLPFLLLSEWPAESIWYSDSYLLLWCTMCPFSVMSDTWKLCLSFPEYFPNARHLKKCSSNLQ